VISGGEECEDVSNMYELLVAERSTREWYVDGYPIQVGAESLEDFYKRRGSF